MITTREGREIIAEALWATATVLHSHEKHDLDSAGGGASCLGETLDQDTHSSDSDPVTNPAAEMVTGALGVAQAAPEMVMEAATGVMLGGRFRCKP
jgi:hypothetical protein